LFAKSFLGGDATSVGHFLIMMPLPIGISFFTFQGITLVVEVFREQRSEALGAGKQRLIATTFAQHLRNTMLFKSFFPTLVAGPIVKAHEFYPQIQPKTFRGIRWEDAFRALVVGYFLKMVIADNLKDSTFWIAYPHFLHLSSLTLAALLFGFSMQIFADFAGYSLIAIGLGHLFGYSLPRNFDFPYLASSFSEFWRRWHISLSTWLKEYLYIPLGGSRHGEFRTYLNLFIVMFLGGLWHGAAWSYAIWGSFHGLALAAERLCKDWIRLPRNRLVQALQVLAVFSFVTLAWLLFKLPNITEAAAYFRAILTNRLTEDFALIASVIVFSAPVVAYYAWHLMKRRWRAVNRAEFLVLGMLVAGIVLNSGSAQKFIYFQF
jgi:alginate O-acetyltransferase complex protein AlgI